VAGIPVKPPRDEGALIELLIELCAAERRKLQDPDARDYLQGTRHKKKLREIMMSL
jgi:hypothetical protein